MLQHQRMAQVVDVFGSAGEVDEFRHFRDFGIAGEAFLEEILDGFDVVIGRRLDRFDPLAVDGREAVRQRIERGDGRC